MRVRIGSFNNAHRPDESVPFADNRLQEARFSGVVTQSRADFSHNVVDIRLGVYEEVRVPESRGDIVARNQLIPPTDQENQKFHGLLLKLYAASAAAKLVAPEVQFHLSRYWLCLVQEALSD